MKNLMNLFIALFLIGCATGKSTNIDFSPSPVLENKAIVYLYRPSVAANSLNFDIPNIFSKKSL